MSGQELYKGIPLAPEIDREYLHSLYEDDYQYLAQVFQTTLEQLDEDIEKLNDSYKTGDIVGMKRAVHKIKPSFGFTGLLSMQEKCKQFEELCAGQPAREVMENAYELLLNNVLQGKAVILRTCQQLKSYNAQ